MKENQVIEHIVNWLKNYNSQVVCNLDDGLFLEDKVKLMYDYISSCF